MTRREQPDARLTATEVQRNSGLICQRRPKIDPFTTATRGHFSEDADIIKIGTEKWPLMWGGPVKWDRAGLEPATNGLTPHHSRLLPIGRIIVCAASGYVAYRQLLVAVNSRCLRS